jgi:hypothetical protein
MRSNKFANQGGEDANAHANASMGSHMMDHKANKSLYQMLSEAGENAVHIEEEECEEEQEEMSGSDSDKKVSISEQMNKIRKHLIAKSAKEIIPAEFSHLFGKVDKKKFKPKKKQRIIKTKVYTLV